MKTMFICFHLERCKLSVNNISLLLIKTDETQRELVTENTETEHGVEVSIQCINGSYQLESTEDPHRVGGITETAVCKYGKWENFYRCTRSKKYHNIICTQIT